MEGERRNVNDQKYLSARASNTNDQQYANNNARFTKDDLRGNSNLTNVGYDRKPQNSSKVTHGSQAWNRVENTQGVGAMLNEAKGNSNDYANRSNQNDSFNTPIQEALSFSYGRPNLTAISDAKNNTAKVSIARSDRDIAFVSTTRKPEVAAPVKSYILWIDECSQENSFAETQLKIGQDIHIDFCPEYPNALNHLQQILDKIRSPSTTFQIICRGYYRNVDKNPLDLLLFLNQLNLQYIPVVVFTRNKEDLESHFRQQTSSKGIYNWQQRLAIVVDVQELTKVCHTNIKKKIDANVRPKAN